VKYKLMRSFLYMRFSCSCFLAPVFSGLPSLTLIATLGCLYGPRDSNC